MKSQLLACGAVGIESMEKGHFVRAQENNSSGRRNFGVRHQPEVSSLVAEAVMKSTAALYLSSALIYLQGMMIDLVAAENCVKADATLTIQSLKLPFFC